MNKKLAYPSLYFETKAWEQNNFVCGIDEVGRGCLAGPLVVAAAIIPQQTKNEHLRDSKLMTENQRLQAFEWIKNNCWYQVSITSNHDIDQQNIYASTLQAMKQSYISLLQTLPFNFETLKYILVDAMPLKLSATHLHKNLEIHHFNYGESVSPSIAAASIVAKVTRDELMKKMSSLFPAFDFEKHKGYGTKKHQAALEKYGPTLIHRKSFLTKLRTKAEDDHQQSLF